jgi:predicted ABC-type ATPase
MQPRFRLFAGPNGSGKTSLFNFLREQSFIHTEVYVNADNIEKKISDSLSFNFNAYRVKVSDAEFKHHIRRSGILKKIKDHSLIDKVEIKSGVLKMHIRKREVNSYAASFIASYLAEKLIESKQSFCYETVLSHASKISLLRLASKQGYKTYLYFIFTDNWELNVERVKLRVRGGGHDVDNKKIEQRYFRSLKLVKDVVQDTDDAYLIDNSRDFDLVAHLKNGKTQFVTENYPQWFKKYFKPSK